MTAVLALDPAASFRSCAFEIAGNQSNLGRVYHAIAGHGGLYGKAFPSLATIAKECEISMKTVQRMIAKLENAGILKKEHGTRKSGRFASNRYLLADITDIIESALAGIRTEIRTKKAPGYKNPNADKKMEVLEPPALESKDSSTNPTATATPGAGHCAALNYTNYCNIGAGNCQEGKHQEKPGTKKLSALEIETAGDIAEICGNDFKDSQIRNHAKLLVKLVPGSGMADREKRKRIFEIKYQAMKKQMETETINNPSGYIYKSIRKMTESEIDAEIKREERKQNNGSNAESGSFIPGETEIKNALNLAKIRDLMKGQE